MILYAGQKKMHFSAANFATGSYSPNKPYTNYLDEAIYFTNDPAIVHSFMRKYDDLWTQHHALPESREHQSPSLQTLSDVCDQLRPRPQFPSGPGLHGPRRSAAQAGNQRRSMPRYSALPPPKFRTSLSSAVKRGPVPVRLITDPSAVSEHGLLLGLIQRGSHVHGGRRRKGEEESESRLIRHW